MSDRLKALGEAGQAVWLDYLHRRILDDGALGRQVASQGVKGVTSNPAIFEKAIAEGDAYDDRLRTLIAARDTEVIDLYEQLAIADIQAAADQLRPVFDAQGGRDGFVSLEVSPYLATDSDGTLTEARRLWRAVDRPNLMIKVPGTPAGIPVIRLLIGEGINVNVTLLFSIDAYLAVAEAHLAGLEDLRAAGGDVGAVQGVASFFVSRIDGEIDARIDARLGAASAEDRAALMALRGKVAIANAKVAYLHYLEMVAGPRWRALAAAGAAPQRLLWASTGTKDPAYSDVLYVENLIGADTVNTMPPATLAAFADHGVARMSLTEDVAGAHHVLAETQRLGLDLAGVTATLAIDGVAKFAQAFDSLLAAVADKRARILGARLNGLMLAVSGSVAPAYADGLARAAAEGWTRRLWAKDAALWTDGDEAAWLGWLGAGLGVGLDLQALDALRADASSGPYDHALLLGMGGSSLGPEVIAAALGTAPGFPRLLVLDSTDPLQVARTAAMIDPARTLFIVASKSGSTLEPDILHRYFWALTEQRLGAGKAAARFVAITDPGSKLEAIGRRDGFAHILLGDPGIGGRYSVLSIFGLGPAAIMGLDVREIIKTTAVMARACGASAPPAANPGFKLGLLLGAAAEVGRDKVTVIASGRVAGVGAWLEQLIAESTGKQGRGLIPVDGEPVGPVAAYGADRVFAHLRVAGDDNAADDAATAALEAAGHPVIRIDLATPHMVFQEFFRWEVAIAVASAEIGIHPFDQPDVEASKIKARALTDAYERDGAAATAAPALQSGGLSVFTAESPIGGSTFATLEDALRGHFEQVGAGDYVGLLAWLDRDHANEETLRAMRRRLRDRLHVATVVGFGPRFLHSTGQAYKGGPNSGVFLQITAQAALDLAVPGRDLSFGVVEAAQAAGDLAVLVERGRRVLRIDLGGDVAGGLRRLALALERAIG